MNAVTRPLDTLAAAIRREHEAAARDARSALEHARNAGALLLEVKGRLPHGAWADWLAANFPDSDRTARAYMRIAAHWPELEAQNGNALPIREALRLLGAPAPADRVQLLLQFRRAAREVACDLASELDELETLPASEEALRRCVAVIDVAGRLLADHAEVKSLAERWAGQLLAEAPGATP